MTTGIRLRELASPAEFALAQRVAKAAWRLPDLEAPSVADLIAITHAGGLTAGAFRGKDLLGFVHGFPREIVGRRAQHSHLLAVRPDVQGRGLSKRLKLFQREWCLARGIGLVTWTYDPLLVKNARLNLVRLRARARRYLRDFYGPIGGIYADLPTDRFEVFWELDAPDVRRVAAGEEFPEPTLEGAVPFRFGRDPESGRTSVEIPTGAPKLYRSDPAGARRARFALRRRAEDLMARGWEASALALENGRAFYLFER
ncbi:MAG TPA: GNAT family N-acetyltransferase [Thermoanaerobaculia bacterium]|nr:GNAT family N-acetyltransferase [Thermoanaerobaculia bacterium]